MKQEYYVETKCHDEYFTIFKKELIKDMTISTSAIPNTSKTIISVKTKHNDQKAAKKLSNYRMQINKHNLKLHYIYDGASSYYNRNLYKYISSFEIKLREVIVLADSLIKDKNFHVSQLENDGLMDLFAKLLFDTEYVAFVKKGFDNFRKGFTKKELKELIDAREERKNVISDIYEDCNDLTIVNNFRTINKYRNAVMHSKSINHENFIEAKTMILSAKKELNKITCALLGADTKEIYAKFAYDLTESLQIFNNSLIDYVNTIKPQIVAAGESVAASLAKVIETSGLQEIVAHSATEALRQIIPPLESIQTDLTNIYGSALKTIDWDKLSNTEKK